MIGAWRLEWIRLWRTRRLVGVLAAFVLVGLGEPVLIYYLPELIERSGSSIQVIAPDPVPADAIVAYIGDAMQLGLLIVLVVAAAGLTVDSRPHLAAFYRTRVRTSVELVLPRYVAVTAASIAALVAGMACAWYETEVLLGHVSAARLGQATLLLSAELCFATAVVALFSSLVRSVAAVVGSSVALLLVLGLLGTVVDQLAAWLPTHLSTAATELVRGDDPRHPWWTAAVTLLASGFVLVAAIRQFGRRG